MAASKGYVRTPEHREAMRILNQGRKHSAEWTRRVSESKTQTHCDRGHALTPDNVVVRKSSGRRSCKACHIKSGASAHLRRKYGLTIAERDEMREKQNNLCLMCTKPFQDSDNWLRPVVDHDHETMVVRGLIHNACNVVLGIMGENTSILRSAIEYLECRK